TSGFKAPSRVLLVNSGVVQLKLNVRSSIGDIRFYMKLFYLFDLGRKIRYLPFFFLLIFILDVASITVVSTWLGGKVSWALGFLFLLLGIFILKNYRVNWAELLSSWQRSQTSSKQTSWYKKSHPLHPTLAACLFILPGFLSDTLGLALLLPLVFQNFSLPSRANKSRKATSRSPKQPPQEKEIIEGQFREIAEPSQKKRY
ncbi:MAG: FxsA family protein, partial [Neisseriaceae bacterium]